VIGDAVMTEGGSVLRADRIKLFRQQRIAIATGNVHLIDPDVEMWATDAKLDVANETLELHNARIQARKSTYRLDGKKIVKLPGQSYQITSGFFTTCASSGQRAPDCAITGDEMSVDI